MSINLAIATVPEAHQLWLSSLSALGRSPNTISLYEYSVRGFIEWRSGNADLLTTSRFEALAYTKMLNESYKPNGVHSRVKSLRAFFSWCVAEEFLTVNPFARMRISLPEEPRPTPDDGVVDAMLASAKRSRRDLAMLTIMVDTGCRRGEVAALSVHDIDLGNGMITFPVSKCAPRRVPMSDRAIVAVGRWLRQRGVQSGNLWNVTDAYSLVKTTVHKHSGGAFTPHALRRAFACRFLARGGSETSLMRLCGWASIAQVRRYTMLRGDQIAADEFRRLMA